MLRLALACSYLLTLVASAACRESNLPPTEVSSGGATTKASHPRAGSELPNTAGSDDGSAEPQPRSVSRGLDVGMKLKAFDSLHWQTRTSSCPVCETPPGGVVIAFGDLNDEGFVESLLDLQAIQQRFEAPSFSVVVLAASGDGDEADQERLE